jgi:hypothetical protein
MERQVTLKSIIIPSLLGLIAQLVICSLISHEVFADSPSFPIQTVHNPVINTIEPITSIEKSTTA